MLSGESRFKGASPRFLRLPHARLSARLVNDVHSQLNPTLVRRIVRPTSIRMLQDVVRDAAAGGTAISVAGGRHAMGGQQFGRDTTLVDMRAMDRVLELDHERGLVTVEAGIQWPRLINHLLWASAGQENGWGIVQKQTGADRLTLGGALGANIHGRGLRMRPFVADIESFELIDASGQLLPCSRTTNRRLFEVAIGGYGLFGVVTTMTLRLARRHKVERRVAIASADDLPLLFEDRIAAGFEFGDFQFATEPSSREFLRTGVLACYRPAADDPGGQCEQRALTPADWQRLLLLAHEDKSRAFAEYARHYMSTDGQVYWSDTHQLSAYIDDYHDSLDRQLAAPVKGSEMITELFVPRPDLPAFLSVVREEARRAGMNVIYGTIRLIEEDDETFLRWARQPWACVVMNLHVDHSPAGLATARRDFTRLIDIAIEFGGSYYLTYHRWARPDQVERCHPRMRDFLRLKQEFDPQEIFSSDWYYHHVDLLGGDREEDL